MKMSLKELLTVANRLARAGAAEVVRASMAFLRFFVPVAGSVRNRFMQGDIARALSKAVITGAGSSVWGLMQSPTIIAGVWIPLGVAVIVGVFEALILYASGTQNPKVWTPGYSQSP